MACTFTGSIEGDRALMASDRITEITDMLCRTLTLYEEATAFIDEMGAQNSELKLPKDIAKFWKEHKKLDAKRKAEKLAKFEDDRKRALAKLTPEEIELLNIKV